MTLRTDLTDGTAMEQVHADQHNEVNVAVVALQAAGAIGAPTQLSFVGTGCTLIGTGTMDGVALTGGIAMSGMAQGLISAAALGTVITQSTVAVTTIPLSTTAVDIAINITVSDLTLTNSLVLSHTFVTAPGDLSFSSDINETTCGDPARTGVDLNMASGIVTSTSGGLFLVNYAISLAWD